MSLNLFIPGTPTPKQGMNVRAFYDKKLGKSRGMAIPKAATVANCHTMRSLLVQQLPSGFVPIDKPVEIDYFFIYPPLKGFKKTQQRQIESGYAIIKETAPDGDNLEKAVNDAMNGVVLTDDKLIWKHSAMKAFGKLPGIYMTIREYNPGFAIPLPFMLPEEPW